MRALKMRSSVAGLWKFLTTNWEDHQSWSSNIYMRSCQELSVNHFKVIQHLKQIGKVKKLSKWVPHEQAKKFLKPSFCSVIFFYSMQQQTILQLDCDMQWKVDFIRQLVKTSSVVGPRRSFKALPKAKLAPKKVLVSGNLLSIRSSTAFWILAKPLHLRMLRCNLSMYRYAQQINDMHRKLQCLQPALVNRKGPILLHNKSQPHVAQPTLQNLNKLGYRCHIHAATYSTRPDTSLSISTTFCGENTSTSSRRQKMLSKSLLNPKTWIFMLQKETNLFLIGKNVLIVMVYILINKDIVKPSYNDLKITIWNHNYFFTNLNI